MPDKALRPYLFLLIEAWARFTISFYFSCNTEYWSYNWIEPNI